LNEA
jgi:hypothetical protein